MTLHRTSLGLVTRAEHWPVNHGALAGPVTAVWSWSPAGLPCIIPHYACHVSERLQIRGQCVCACALPLAVHHWVSPGQLQAHSAEADHILDVVATLCITHTSKTSYRPCQVPWCDGNGRLISKPIRRGRWPPITALRWSTYFYVHLQVAAEKPPPLVDCICALSSHPALAQLLLPKIRQPESGASGPTSHQAPQPPTSSCAELEGSGFAPDTCSDACCSDCTWQPFFRV